MRLPGARKRSRQVPGKDSRQRNSRRRTDPRRSRASETGCPEVGYGMSAEVRRRPRRSSARTVSCAQPRAVAGDQGPPWQAGSCAATIRNAFRGAGSRRSPPSATRARARSPKIRPHLRAKAAPTMGCAARGGNTAIPSRREPRSAPRTRTSHERSTRRGKRTIRRVFGVLPLRGGCGDRPLSSSARVSGDRSLGPT